MRCDEIPIESSLYKWFHEIFMSMTKPVNSTFAIDLKIQHFPPVFPPGTKESWHETECYVEPEREMLVT